MFLSPRSRKYLSSRSPRGALLVALASAAFATSCAAPPADECVAYLACFYPEDDTKGSPFEDDLMRPELADEEERARALYGQGGECWKNGTEDPFYATCQTACIEAIREECDAFAASTGGVCVRDEGGEVTFAPEDGSGPAVSCAAL